MPDIVAIASPNGAKSAAKADWRPLAGRTLIVWPDADAAGAAYAQEAAKLALEASAASVTFIAPPAGVAEGFDAADALAEGWTTAQAGALIAAAKPFAERADLAERCVVARLSAIHEESRRPEDELEAEWAIARPRVLGALFDAVSSALRRIGSTKLARSSRMADFEKWIAAAEPGLGWEPGSFSAAYERRRRDSESAAFESDQVAVAIDDFMTRDGSRLWSGTATELLGHLSSIVSEQIRQMRIWPKTAQGLGNCIDRSTPLLRTKGIVVERRHSGVRTITISRRGEGNKTTQTPNFL